MPSPLHNRRTAYRSVAEDLRRLVSSGERGTDRPLPTEMELARRYGVSRQTVRRAFLDLVNEGLVYRVAGRGTFVRPAESHYRQTFTSVDDLMGLRERTEMRIVSPLRQSGTPRRAVTGWPDGPSWQLGLVRSHQETVFCHTQVWLPNAVGQRLAEHPDLSRRGAVSRHTIIGLIEQEGFVIHHALQATTAAAAGEEENEVLGCEVGSPLLVYRRTYLDSAGTAVEHAESLFLPEHYTHTVALSRRPGGEAPDPGVGP